jgi:hypothetical protein
MAAFLKGSGIPVPTPNETLVAGFIAGLAPADAYRLAVGHPDSARILTRLGNVRIDRIASVTPGDMSDRAYRADDIIGCLKSLEVKHGTATRRVLADRIGVDRTGLVALMEGKTRPWPWTDAALAHTIGADILDWWRVTSVISDREFLDGVANEFAAMGRDILSGDQSGTGPVGNANDHGFRFVPFDKPVPLGALMDDKWIDKSLVVRVKDSAFRMHFRTRRLSVDRTRGAEIRDTPWLEASMCFLDSKTLLERGKITTMVGSDWNELLNNMLENFRIVDQLPVVGVRVSCV